MSVVTTLEPFCAFLLPPHAILDLEIVASALDLRNAWADIPLATRCGMHTRTEMYPRGNTLKPCAPLGTRNVGNIMEQFTGMYSCIVPGNKWRSGTS